MKEVGRKVSVVDGPNPEPKGHDGVWVDVASDLLPPKPTRPRKGEP